MLHQFRHHYPQGSLISELVNIDRGLYIVKVSVQDRTTILGTGLAAAETVEKAEDKARQRALMTLDLEKVPVNNSPVVKPAPASKPQPAIEPITTIPTQETYYPAIESVPPVANNLELIPEPVLTAPPLEMEEYVPPEETQTNIFDQPLTSPSEKEVAPPEEAQTNIFDRPLTPPPVEEVAPPETENEIEFDFNEIKHRIDLEMKRLSWTKEQGRDYLLSTYGKRSRLHLTDPELLEFLDYLENLPG